MKNSYLSKTILIFSLLMWSGITGASEYFYSDLRMLSYDDMLNRVKSRILKAEKVANDDVDEAQAELRNAVQLILARPNSDNMVSQLLPTARTPLRNLEVYESTLLEITDAALATLKDKKAEVKRHATALIILTNLMSELKPDLQNNKTAREVFEKIKGAKIEVSKTTKNEFRLRASMSAPESPSDVAAKVLAGVKPLAQ